MQQNGPSTIHMVEFRDAEHGGENLVENRVVITGLGAITPVGLNIDEFWNSICQGKSGVSRITRFDAGEFSTKIAAEVNGFNPTVHIKRKDVRRMDPFAQYAVSSAVMAIEDAKLDLRAEDLTRIGVIVGSGIGGIDTLEKQHILLLQKGPSKISPFFIPMMILDMAPGLISMVLGVKGPNYSTVSACSSSAHAIGDAFRILQRGDADVVIAGGTEAPVTPLSIGGFCAMKALSVRNDEPERASRPFDAERDGFVLGEGAGVVIMETLDHALQRGAPIYGEIVGYGNTADAYHLTAPAPEGDGQARSMQMALIDAGLRPEEVDYINAHGTSTPLNDRFETIAIKRVFGEHAYRSVVSSTKSMIGHLLGAAGVVEFIATVLAAKHSLIPPTINYENPDPECDLDYAPNQARSREVHAAITNSFGFGGHNVTLAVKKFPE